MGRLSDHAKIKIMEAWWNNCSYLFYFLQCEPISMHAYHISQMWFPSWSRIHSKKIFCNPSVIAESKPANSLWFWNQDVDKSKCGRMGCHSTRPQSPNFDWFWSSRWGDSSEASAIQSFFGRNMAIFSQPIWPLSYFIAIWGAFPSRGRETIAGAHSAQRP